LEIDLERNVEGELKGLILYPTLWVLTSGLCSSRPHAMNTEVGAKWGDPSLTSQLRGQWEDYYPSHYNQWHKLTKTCIDHILEAFKKESRRYSKREGEELTYANYFKNQRYVARMLQEKLTADIRQSARFALKP